MTDAKLYIVMRSDLKMGRGKEIAQAIHAFRFMPIRTAEIGSDGRTFITSAAHEMAVICVRADSEAVLREIIAEEALNGSAVSPIHDAGRTHNEPGTLTCAAIGPLRECGPLLRAARLY